MTTVFRKDTHTQTGIWTSGRTTLWCIKWQWHALCSIELRRTALMYVPDRDKEEEHVVQALRNNGYPESLAAMNWHPSAALSCNPDRDPPKATVTLPYIRHVSECIWRILKPLGILMCFRPHCTLHRALVKVKDPTPAQQRAGVVYRIPCGTCPKVYIG